MAPNAAQQNVLHRGRHPKKRSTRLDETTLQADIETVASDDHATEILLLPSARTWRFSNSKNSSINSTGIATGYSGFLVQVLCEQERRSQALGGAGILPKPLVKFRKFGM